MTPMAHRVSTNNNTKKEIIINIENYEDYIPKDIYDNIKDSNVKANIYNALMINCPPNGISKELWNGLQQDDKVAVIEAIDYIETQKKHTSILRKIYQRIDQHDIEPSMNTLALICALIIGIPFGISQLFNEQQLLLSI